jgi:hypothetical protein
MTFEPGLRGELAERLMRADMVVDGLPREQRRPQLLESKVAVVAFIELLLMRPMASLHPPVQLGAVRWQHEERQRERRTRLLELRLKLGPPSIWTAFTGNGKRVSTCCRKSRPLLAVARL